MAEEKKFHHLGQQGLRQDRDQDCEQQARVQAMLHMRVPSSKWSCWVGSFVLLVSLPPLVPVNLQQWGATMEFLCQLMSHDFMIITQYSGRTIQSGNSRFLSLPFKRRNLSILQESERNSDFKFAAQEETVDGLHCKVLTVIWSLIIKWNMQTPHLKQSASIW